MTKLTEKEEAVVTDANMSAAQPRRLPPADPNGARRWGLSTSVAVILFGFAIAFGTYVSLTERESAKERWQTVGAGRYAEDARSGPRSERGEARDSSSSTLSSRASDSLVALVQPQIDSVRMDGANNATNMNDASDSAPRHESSPPLTQHPDSPVASVAPSPPRSPAHGQTAIRAPEKPAAPESTPLQAQAPKGLAPINEPAPCNAEDASTCATTTPPIDSQTERGTADHANTVQTGSVIQNVQDTLPPRAVTTKQSARAHSAERVASAAPKHSVPRALGRPPAKGARREPQPQADVPVFAQLRHIWKRLRRAVSDQSAGGRATRGTAQHRNF